MASPSPSPIPNQTIALEKNEEQDPLFDYSERSQWLRAAVLGAIDGSVSTASLMMGVGAVNQEIKPMVLTGFAGLVAGSSSMAIGEFVSVYSQLDIEIAHLRRVSNNNKNNNSNNNSQENACNSNNKLPNPIRAALASALAFSIGAIVPLLGASFLKDYEIRVCVVLGSVSLAMGGFGWLGAALGRAPAAKGAARVVVGGWLAMGVTFGLTKLIGGSRGL